MSICEKCWSDASLRAQVTGRSTADCYREITEERKDNPCSEAEQRGEFKEEK